MKGEAFPLQSNTAHRDPAVHFHMVGIKEQGDHPGKGMGGGCHSRPLALGQNTWGHCAVDSVCRRSIWERGLQAELPLRGLEERLEADEEAAGAFRPRGPEGEGRGPMVMMRTGSWLGNTASQVQAGQKMSSAGLGETESSLAVRATHCGLQCPLSACVLNE